MPLPDWLDGHPDVFAQDDKLPDKLAEESEDEVPVEDVEAPDDAE